MRRAEVMLVGGRGCAVRQMLYYPGLNPPEHALYQAVLYWDSIASIAPVEWPDRHRNPGTAPELYLLRLYDEGLYHPLPVQEVPPELDEQFFLHLERLIEKLGEDELRATLDDMDDRNQRVYGTSRFPWLWTDELTRESLAVQLEDQRSVRVHQSVWQLMFMLVGQYLVEQSSRSDAQGPRRFPYTASEAAFEVGNRTAPHQMPCWEVDFGDLLPVPDWHRVSLGEVVEFRHRYNDERLLLMEEIIRLESELRIHHGSHRFELDQARRLALRNALRDFDKAAKASRMTWTRGGVFLFLSGAAGAAPSLLPGAAPLSLPLGYQVMSWALAVAGGAMVNIATTRVAASSSKNDVYRYLQRVQKNYGG